MAQAVAVKQTEGTPAVISDTTYIPAEADYYTQYGNVECVCGKSRYEPAAKCWSCKSAEIAAWQVTDAERKLLNSKTATKARFWYHSTTRANWAESIKNSGLPVHLGNREAAEERAVHEFDGGDSDEYFLFKVVLNPFASISDTVCPDLINGWSNTMEEFAENAGADFVRYVNSAENVGTVSLVGDPKKFIVVEKTVERIPY